VHPLAPAWRDYRNRLAALVIAIAGLVLWADGADGFLADALGGGALLSAAAAGWLTFAAGALVWYGAFPCPYCGACFHFTLWVANPIADRCLHCGFLKWRDPDAARVLSARR
jgi:Zn ribbon nucleic-acid-binding protein